MAKHWRTLRLPGFSDCFCTECDVGRGRPVTKKILLERTNLPLEGYSRALYVPLGGSRTLMEDASLKFVSPCSVISPLVCPSALALLMPEAVGAFSSFLASIAAAFSFFGLYSSAFFFLLGLLLPFLFLRLSLLFLPLLPFFSSFLGSGFNLDGLCNCLRPSFQPGWVM